ncbi:hypothetical protein H1R20_g15633, partial [Candolleomyces eurysporus]
MAALLRDTVSFSKQFNDTFPTIVFSLALCTFPAAISYLFLAHYGNAHKSQKPSALPVPAVESWIPWIGKSVQLMRDPLTFIVESRRKYGPLFEMTTWGSKLIVATDPGMLMSLEHQCKDLNPSTSRVDAFRALTGIHDSERMTEVMGTRIMPVSSKILSPSGTLKSGLMETFNERLMHNFDALTAELKANGPKTMRLSEFISYHLFCASTNSLFGPTFPFDSYPHYAIISSSIQILHSPMANWPFVARKARRARQGMIDALIKYTEDWWHNGGQIEGVSQLVGQSLIIMKEENLSIEEAAGSLLISLWGALFNVSAMTYWLTAQLLVDEKIYTNLREEAVDKHYMEAPLLESAALETLRTGSVPPPTRSVDADAEIVVDGKRYFFQKGSRIISEMSGYHYNPDVYADPHSFKLERFFDESLPRPKPFGEGHHFCRGMHLAKLEIKSFISHALKHFNLRVVGSKELPKLKRAGLIPDVLGSDNITLEVSLRD